MAMDNRTIMAVALGVVFAVLVAGLIVMFRGGSASRNWSNRLMRMRVVAQFLAIIVAMAILYYTSQ
jgi:hypothetical protein